MVTPEGPPPILLTLGFLVPRKTRILILDDWENEFADSDEFEIFECVWYDIFMFDVNALVVSESKSTWKFFRSYENWIQYTNIMFIVATGNSRKGHAVIWFAINLLIIFFQIIYLKIDFFIRLSLNISLSETSWIYTVYLKSLKIYIIMLATSFYIPWLY